MVMSCSREKCENIMCDTYVDGIGYVCTECQEEFKEYLDTHINKSESEIRSKLREFIMSDKDTYKKGQEMNVDEFFSKYTNG